MSLSYVLFDKFPRKFSSPHPRHPAFYNKNICILTDHDRPMHHDRRKNIHSLALVLRFRRTIRRENWDFTSKVTVLFSSCFRQLLNLRVKLTVKTGLTFFGSGNSSVAKVTTEELRGSVRH